MQSVLQTAMFVIAAFWGECKLDDTWWYSWFTFTNRRMGAMELQLTRGKPFILLLLGKHIYGLISWFICLLRIIIASHLEFYHQGHNVQCYYILHSTFLSLSLYHLYFEKYYNRRSVLGQCDDFFLLFHSEQACLDQWGNGWCFFFDKWYRIHVALDLMNLLIYYTLHTYSWSMIHYLF